jgi:hypothetical protein
MKKLLKDFHQIESLEKLHTTFRKAEMALVSFGAVNPLFCPYPAEQVYSFCSKSICHSFSFGSPLAHLG